MALPRYVVLGVYVQNRASLDLKHVKYVEEEGEAHGFLQLSKDGGIFSPYSKMEVEEAKLGKGLVHLRCCYNNRYWARNSSSNNWITCSSDHKDEDQTKWSCTLFKPEIVDKDHVQFLHVQLGHYVTLSTGAAPFTDCLIAGYGFLISNSKFSFYDWESYVLLPKYVAFKGFNGKYLSVQDNSQMKFNGTDIGSSRVGNEITTDSSGTIIIKSLLNGVNWMINDSNRFQVTPTIQNVISSFESVKLSTNSIALKHLEKGFCYADDENDPFRTGLSSIEQKAKLTVEELVVSRQIYNVDFRLSDARIYDQSVFVVSTVNAENSGDVADQQELTVKYENKRSSSWKTSFSLTLGVKTTIETGIPMIAEGKIELSAKFKGAYEWGVEEESSLIQSVYKVTVPPKTRLKVSLVASKGTCDVPFSYSQRDTLTDGRAITQTMHDGIYTGINSYNFQYQTTHVETFAAVSGAATTSSDVPPHPHPHPHHHHHHHKNVEHCD